MPAPLLYILLLFLPLHTPAADDLNNSEWELVKDEDNIKVFTADAEHSSFKKIKVTAVVEGKWENIVPVFQDIANYDKWVYATDRSYPIKKVSDGEILYYIETDLPWPAKNRDAAIRMKIKNGPGGSLLVDTEGEPNATPTTDGNVRVENFTGKWAFQKAGRNKIKVTYYLNLDPGGGLPSWVVNMFVAKGPHETIAKLSDRLKM